MAEGIERERQDLDTKISYIKKQACFSQLNDKEVTELAPLWIEKFVPAGQVIVVEGDPVDSVFLIVKGVAEVRHDRIIDGKLVSEKLAELSVGASIGLNETGFYSLSGRRTATVAAMTDMVLFRLNVAAFHGFALTHPHVNHIMRGQAIKTMNHDSDELS